MALLNVAVIFGSDGLFVDAARLRHDTDLQILYFTRVPPPFRDGDASKHELGIEPRVFLDLSNGDPLLWVIGQHFLQQILAFLVIANAAPGVVLPEFIEIALGQRTEPSIAVMRLLKGRVKINNTTPILKMSQAKS